MQAPFDDTLMEAQNAWMDIDGVEGVAQGLRDGTDTIVVFVSMRTPEIDRNIPPTFKGIPVEIRESGKIIAG